MSGIGRLGLACLSKCCWISIRWSFQPADEKFLWITSAQTVVSCLCWCVEPHFFSHLLLDWQKYEYLSSFLEAVPRLVIHQLLQPVVRFRLRLVIAAAAAAAAASCCCWWWWSWWWQRWRWRWWWSSSSFSSSKQSSTLLASAPDSESVPATRISLMAFSSSLIFFLATANNYNGLPYLVSVYDRHSFRNLMPVRYEHLLHWQQNRSKATMWLLYKIPAIRRCPRCF